MVSEATRDHLARVKAVYGAPSIDATIQRLMAAATPDAKALYKTNKRKVDAVCKKYGLKTLIAFGSRVREDRTPGSDLDLVTAFPKGSSLFDLVHAQDDLSEAFGVRVDLGTLQSAHPSFRTMVEQEGARLV